MDTRQRKPNEFFLPLGMERMLRVTAAAALHGVMKDVSVFLGCEPSHFQPLPHCDQFFFGQFVTVL